MPSPYGGLVMCTVKSYDEIYQRLYGNSGSQVEEIRRGIHNIVQLVYYLSTDMNRFVVSNEEINSHSQRMRSRAPQYIRWNIERLLGHVCVIGDDVAMLLRDTYYYSELYDDSGDMEKVFVDMAKRLREEVCNETTDTRGGVDKRIRISQ